MLLREFQSVIARSDTISRSKVKHRMCLEDKNKNMNHSTMLIDRQV